MDKLIYFSEKYQNNSIHTIKLKNLLEIRDSNNLLRQIKTMFPSIEIGSITLVDQIILLALIELASPMRILEIGTYQGYTTRLFLDNTSDCEILTIDLPILDVLDRFEINYERILSDAECNDEYLKKVQNNSGAPYLEKLNYQDTNRLKLIKLNSKELDFKSVIGKIDFAFIDGGHDYATIRSDTENVRSIMKKGVIVWHDYSSSIHSDVTRYLSEYAKENQVFYVSNGLCAFQIINF